MVLWVAFSIPPSEPAQSVRVPIIRARRQTAVEHLAALLQVREQLVSVTLQIFGSKIPAQFPRQMSVGENTCITERGFWLGSQPARTFPDASITSWPSWCAEFIVKKLHKREKERAA